MRLGTKNVRFICHHPELNDIFAHTESRHEEGWHVLIQFPFKQTANVAQPRNPPKAIFRFCFTNKPTLPYHASSDSNTLETTSSAGFSFRLPFSKRPSNGHPEQTRNPERAFPHICGDARHVVHPGDSAIHGPGIDSLKAAGLKAETQFEQTP